MDKKTLSIPEDQNQFLKDTGINASRLLQTAIEHLRENVLTDEDIKMLKRMNRLDTREMNGLEEKWQEMEE